MGIALKDIVLELHAVLLLSRMMALDKSVLLPHVVLLLSRMIDGSRQTSVVTACGALV